MPKPFFGRRPFGTAEEEGMYNRLKTALEANSYGVSLRTTVYTPEIREATVYRTPNYGDLPI
jgi:hypothetical protein